MRSLVRQHVSAVAKLRCSSSFHRFTSTQASRGGPVCPPWCFSSIENNQRCFSTTTALRKQLPTSTGSSSSAAVADGGGSSSSAAGSHRSRKQTRRHLPSASAASSRSGPSAAAAVEPELESAPLPVNATTASTSSGAAASVPVAAQHRSGKSDTAASRAKAPKRGPRKQGSGSSPRGSSPTIGPTGTARRRPIDEATSLPPVEPPTVGVEVVGSETAGSNPISSTRAKKKVKDARGRRRATGTHSRLNSSSPAEGGPHPTLTVAPMHAVTTDSVSSQPPSAGSLAPIYYTRNMLANTPRTEEQRIAERCSFTKLIMVSASVSFLFTALPRSEGHLKTYVRDMNQVQVPSSASAPVATTTTTLTEPFFGAASAADALPPAIAPALTSRQFHELRQRLCAEQYATNTVFIHVREMEQLVPPPHLQSPPAGSKAAETNSDAAAAVAASAQGDSTPGRAARESKMRGRRSRRSRSGEAAASATSLSPPSPASSGAPLPALTPVQRLLALQEWKKVAARRARETQARYPIPAHFHAITRVRFHNPHQTDLTVSLGGGWKKSPNSVLRAIVRSMHEKQRGSGELADHEGRDSDSSGERLQGEEEEDDDDDDSSLPPFLVPDPVFTMGEVVTEAAADNLEQEQPAFLALPFAVKPLLTVCASCVPRREAWIGTCSPKPSTTSAVRASATEAESPYMMRPLPTVPRFSTRITIMLEHDEMDPADLVSLAEISTTRKPASATAARASSAPAFGVPSDVSVRGGGVDVSGGHAADFTDTASVDAQRSCSKAKRPLRLYCLVQDAGEY